MSHPLDAIFRPRSIAVVGASRKQGNIGAEVFRSLIRHGFGGPVYPVNPAAQAIQSVRAYPSVLDIPDSVDLAVITVPAHRVLGVVDECAEKGIRGLVVISAGFAEVGEEGAKRQRQLLEKARAHGMRMVGPNCLGVLSTEPGVEMDATFAPTWPPAGNVAIASQSGAVGIVLLDSAKDLGLGISHFVSTGNKADLSGNDLLDYWEDDPSTRVILLYLESFGNPRRFKEIATRVSRKKPILVVKSGRSAAGARAAVSHTGALAAPDVAVDALLTQSGVLRTETMEELFDAAALLANQPVPKGRRVAILTNAGGPGIMAADACERLGLEVATLERKTVDGLRAFLPAEASVENPVDMIAGASAEAYRRSLELIWRDPNVDAVLALFVPPLVTEAADVAEAIRAAGRHADKPILTCVFGTHGVPAAKRLLREGRFPTYSYPEAAVLALSHAVSYGEWLQREPGDVPALEGIDVERARRAIAAGQGQGAAAGEGRWLRQREVETVLEAYGIRVPRAEVAAGEGELARAAQAVGFPLVMKLQSDTITHKTEVGGVVLGIRDQDELEAAHRKLVEGLEARGLRDQMQGVLLQEMIVGGIEMFLGVSQAGNFGPVVGFGSGGTSVELWKDVVFRIPPLTEVDAAEMIDAIRGRRLLEGFRGAPGGDVEALRAAILRFDRMVRDLPEIVEMDLNPLIVLPPGQGVVAIDARIRVS